MAPACARAAAPGAEKGAPALPQSYERKFLQSLSKDYPTVAAATEEIINLNAILKLPKPTEHFMSDVHGEAEAFGHILSSASGVIREKVDRVLGPGVPERERAEFAALIYYPERKLAQLKPRQSDLGAWYRQTLYRLIDVCRFMSSKYTRSFVRKRMPKGFRYIIDELLHAHFEDHDKDRYYGRILTAIVDTGRADAFIEAMCTLIRRLAVFRLHIVGDLFDRGARPDVILDQLIAHHSVDVQWGNHDVQWMGAAAGSEVCVASVIRTSLAYNNLETLEDGYGISLRPLSLFAEQTYANSDVSRFLPRAQPGCEDSQEDLWRTARMHKAIAVILFKLECAVIARNPEFGMEGRALLQHIDFQTFTVQVEGRRWPLRDTYFPTVEKECPARLSRAEEDVLAKLCQSFAESERLARHARFLYAKGGIYKKENGNLLFHGAVPMEPDGRFALVHLGGKTFAGRAWMDQCETLARQGFFAPPGSAARRKGQDFLWYLWCGPLSPVFGRAKMACFEQYFIGEPEACAEHKNPYYSLVENEDAAVAEETVRRLFAEFELDWATGHIINGHVPVLAKNGESPVKAGGKLIVIDGGFCKAYHTRTGIAGYTLVFSSHGLSLRSHGPFESTQKAVEENLDILSTVNVFETAGRRIYVEDTDEGRRLKGQIDDLEHLVAAYARGDIKEQA